jgi:ABC-2 type transport system permease protein
VLALCVLVGGAGLVVSGRGLGSMPRLLVWGALVTGYVAFWFALALAVNALGRESATNALVLVGLWLLLVVVVPAAAQATVSRLYPLPSRVEQVGAIRQATAEANREGSRLLARYYEDHPELAPRQGRGEGFATTFIAVQEEVAHRTSPVEEAFGRQLVQQQQALGAFRFLSPALAFQQAVQDVAGSSLERHQHFLEQVGRFRQEWREALLPRTFASQRLGAEEHQRLPRFTYEEEPQAQVLGRAAVGLLALLLPTAALLALALRRLASSALPASAP